MIFFLIQFASSVCLCCYDWKKNYKIVRPSKSMRIARELYRPGIPEPQISL